ncbi:undecaprenyldiphospho-muramoylpentapeptide beta-N-acetylglucosaminyltransferase [Weissella confusa]|uniref:UDP-N-acetylglucosamine--N-acetylmuramyl-(pentapeptide) pyrophosphoryl-undecaprenol N-acetylglucosamine transferase n=1 Tax=Weissella fermenti TaxID=2987699 RepID=A0ABT6D3X9_9LACO|nr:MULTISPECIES: undecaprenyldiphospho-muramoylpentapeptide beta-N-acetylglucosaminyltransferase [Weissella]MBJ7688127.1 undecaprenyldiphospho-muramoylpentapeptide beta-N-acetylglucosaminyltransferase [Weissella confusa]MCW0926217.1 undecaprenyldiphospho-muramoylpentapeptide beta-N-acetylglucosaminyltransferase [Weissella sp. LMG 11983]MDF9300230.1 undecaprenyldiphospho-muramoylpentapeptide beta-N-acetylglucosaminyltransferase [Weissella sp. BK2]
MRIVVSGGGTGGHIYPALATVKQLKQLEPDTEVLYIGGERGLEKSIVPEAGFDFKALAVQGFSRSLSLDNVKTVYLFLTATRKAKKMLEEFKPDVVVGTGGYVSGPVLYAAQQLKIPTVIHEQNSVVGVTNKFLARHVTKVGVAFPAALSAFKGGLATVVGNPRAQEVVDGEGSFDWDTLHLSADKPTVLIFGGSQGALKLNKAMVAGMSKFANRPYQVIFVTGGKRYDDVQADLRAGGVVPAENVAVVPYIGNMPQLMPVVDLVVGRAGATSLAEQTALGKPMVLIPSPYVTNDHQTKNARSLVEAGAAEMITEESLSGTTLFGTIDHLMTHDDQRAAMAKAAKELGVPDAADQFIKLIKTVIK